MPSRHAVPQRPDAVNRMPEERPSDYENWSELGRSSLNTPVTTPKLGLFRRGGTIMALPARRRDSKAETVRDDDPRDALDGSGVLAALEHEAIDDTDGDVPRGIAFGALFGLALWVGIVGAYFLLAIL
jgi:hypothetical protein